MKQPNPTLKKAMIEALEKSLGIVTTAAKVVGIDRSTHYEWLKTDEAYKSEVNNLLSVKKDFVESQLMQLVKNGDTAATIFASKALLKDRGYIERQEITGAEGGPVQIIAPDNI